MEFYKLRSRDYYESEEMRNRATEVMITHFYILREYTYHTDGVLRAQYQNLFGNFFDCVLHLWTPLEHGHYLDCPKYVRAVLLGLHPEAVDVARRADRCICRRRFFDPEYFILAIQSLLGTDLIISLIDGILREGKRAISCTEGISPRSYIVGLNSINTYEYKLTIYDPEKESTLETIKER